MGVKPITKSVAEKQIGTGTSLQDDRRHMKVQKPQDQANGTSTEGM